MDAKELIAEVQKLEDIMNGKETMADIDSNGIGISFHAACPVCDEINLVAEAEKSGDFTLVDLHEQPFPKSVSPYSRVDREFGRR